MYVITVLLYIKDKCIFSKYFSIYSTTYTTSSLFFISIYLFLSLSTAARNTEKSFKVLLNVPRCKITINTKFCLFFKQKYSFFSQSHGTTSSRSKLYFVNFSVQTVTSSSLLPVGLKSMRIVIIR